MQIVDILNKDSFTRDDIVFLLKLTSPEDINLLLEKANQVRVEHCGKDIRLLGNLKFSNYCEQNCLYCKKREDNFSLSRYRISAEEIIETAKNYSNIGMDTIILRSGTDSFYDTDMISYIIYSIKQNIDVSITLSLCERGFDEYNTWRIAGADQYLLKHKTADRMLFSMYHNKDRFTERINHLKLLKRIGFKIGTGSIIGLPLQTEEDIAGDILLSKELGAKMLTFTSFRPMQFTPFQNKKKGDDELVLKTIAAARLALKNVDIPTYSIFEDGKPKVEEKWLNSGANILIANFDTRSQRDNLTTSLKLSINNPDILAYKAGLKNIIKDLS